MKYDARINIIGAGLAGLSAALTIAQKGIAVNLISEQQSERAQSNLAEGGINAALDLMGEGDSPNEHYKETISAGCGLADSVMVRDMTSAAPEIVYSLEKLGVPFNREDGHIVQRYFGGQKKKRSAYAKGSTGKALMVALIDEARKYEASGLVIRSPHHRFERLLLSDGICVGARIRDLYSGSSLNFFGSVIMACGGLNGMFHEATTGTTVNTGSAAATLFAQGVDFANLEFIQYHPTTAHIAGKRLLISEAARGEGGRLFYYTDDGAGSRSYFMEEKYGDRGNLMPRDVVSREIATLGKQVYLDLSPLSKHTWKKSLPDLREEIIHYLGIEPKTEPIPIAPGIHYFMGGINVDRHHRTNIGNLYAAGECACAYHGANRLGGNSLLGAIYGGRVAGETASSYDVEYDGHDEDDDTVCESMRENEREIDNRIRKILNETLGVLRDGETLNKGLDDLTLLETFSASDEMKARLLLSKAMVKSAEERRESIGAHTRLDYPDMSDEDRKKSVARCRDGEIGITFEGIRD